MAPFSSAVYPSPSSANLAPQPQPPRALTLPPFALAVNLRASTIVSSDRPTTLFLTRKIPDVPRVLQVCKMGEEAGPSTEMASIFRMPKCNRIRQEREIKRQERKRRVVGDSMRLPMEADVISFREADLSTPNPIKLFRVPVLWYCSCRRWVIRGVVSRSSAVLLVFRLLDF